jgi:DNA-binding transcriptional LysR family regulator
VDRLTSLTVFTRVVDSGGFSAAARRLNMSVTMVSNHVQALEDRLGARLLNRTTRRVSVTDTGKAYYQRCIQILAELEEADQAAGAQHSTPRGTLRLYASAALVRFISPVVHEFLSRYPETAIELTTGEHMVDLVEEGIDLAIRTTPPPDSSLIVRRLTPWRAILCCSPAYLETHEAPRSAEDLAAHNCLRYAFHPYGDDWRFTAPAGEAVSVRIAGNLLTNSADALRYATLAGQGLFLAPSFVVAEEIRDGRLVRLLPDYLPVEFAINAIYPHRRHLSIKIRSFIELVAERFADQRSWVESAAD